MNELKLYSVLANDGGWHKDPLPRYVVVASDAEEAKEKVRTEQGLSVDGWDLHVSEFEVEGYNLTVTPKDQEVSIIPKSEYDGLTEDSNFLACLEGVGVDNWGGYDYARQEYRENYESEDE